MGHPLTRRFTRAGLAIVGSGLALLGTATAARADPSAGDEHYQLPSAAWLTAASVGDVNGDGYGDIAVQEPSRTWVLLGRTATSVDVSAPSFLGHGFTIDGTGPAFGVTGVGDINGDGLGAVAVRSGDAIAVVFGQRVSTPVNAAQLGGSGFLITSLGAGSGYAFGRVGSGSLFENTSIVALRDSDSPTGRALAVATGTGVKVVYLPADAGGTTIDAANLGGTGYAVDTGGTGRVDFVGDLGDLNGTGHDVLAVSSADQSGMVHVFGVESPGPGGHVSLPQAVADGRAFEFTATGAALENMVVLGNQFGDGRRSIGAVLGGPSPRDLFVLRTPPMGAELKLTDPANGYVTSPWNGNVIDLGDQNADGRDDFGFSSQVVLTSPADSPPFTPGFLLSTPIGSPQIAAAVPDPVPGAAPDIVTVSGQDSPAPGLTAVDVFYSAAAPTFVSYAPPTYSADGSSMSFSATFAVATQDPTRTGGDLELWNAQGVHNTFAALSFDRGTPGVITETATVPAGLPWSVLPGTSVGPLAPGASYRYRMGLQTRSPSGQGPATSFTYEPPAASATAPTPFSAGAAVTPASATSARSTRAVARCRVARATHRAAHRTAGVCKSTRKPAHKPRKHRAAPRPRRR